MPHYITPRHLSNLLVSGDGVVGQFIEEVVSVIVVNFHVGDEDRVEAVDIQVGNPRRYGSSRCYVWYGRLPVDVYEFSLFDSNNGCSTCDI